MAENIHKGHRERVKKEFLANGFNKNTPPHKILEALLFFCLPQGDTNPLAHDLLDRYGTIADVIDAPVVELVTFKGITESNVVLLKLIPTLMRVYNADKSAARPCFRSKADIGDYILGQYVGFTEECLSLLSLDGNARLLSFDIIERGDIGSVGVSTRKIIEHVLKTKARFVIMAHNHPGGNALPSAADERLTKTIASALSHINVCLEDHIVIADNDYVSMKQSERYSEIFE